MPDDLQAREEALRGCICELYRTFARYPFPPKDLNRKYCDDLSYTFYYTMERLLAAPLEQLPVSTFSIEQCASLAAWGSDDDVKHFLPRLLELIAADEIDVSQDEIDAFIILGRIKKLPWLAREQEAVDRYFDALWSVVLLRPVHLAYDPHSAAAWLWEFAHAHADLTSFLRRWESELVTPELGVMPSAHLADAINRSSDDLSKRNNLGWAERVSRDQYAKHFAAPEHQVLSWLASDTVADLLEQACVRWADAPYALMISGAHKWHGWWRQRWSGDTELT